MVLARVFGEGGGGRVLLGTGQDLCVGAHKVACRLLNRCWVAQPAGEIFLCLGCMRSSN